MVIQSFLENINVIENQTIKIEKGQTVEIVQVSLPLSTRKYKKILSIQYKDKQEMSQQYVISRLIPEVCTVQNLMLKFEGPALIVLNVDCESEQDRIVQVKLNCTLDTDIYKEYTEDEEEYE